MGKAHKPPEHGGQAVAQISLRTGGDEMTRKATQVSSETLAEWMRELIEDFNTVRNYDIVDGVHAWTFCSMAMHISRLIEEITGDFNAQEDFLVKCGYYKVAAHPSMEGFPFCRTPDTI